MFIDWMAQYCSNADGLKLIHRVNTIPIKILASFFVENNLYENANDLEKLKQFF